MSDPEVEHSSSIVPPFDAYIEPTVAVLRSASGAIGNDDINREVASHMALSDAVLGVPHGEDVSDQPEAFYRMAWARTYLKKAGLLINPSRGVWELTEAGRAAPHIVASDVVTRARSGVDADAYSPTLPDYLVEELLAIHQAVLAQGVTPVGDELDACYRRFRERFGPDVLEATEGQRLLTLMHGRQGNRDSLVYWLEFKNDADFPAVFGSIAGGSALKFKIYQSNETGDWMTGPPRRQRRLSVDEAVAVATEQRDQFVAAARHLVELARNPDDVDYPALQQRLETIAPDLADSAWGHKYFALIAPTLLDDYHAVGHQAYHLVKLHKVPSDKKYENARFFIGIACQLGIPVTHLGSVLNRRDGNPRPYWRVGTDPGEGGKSEWPRMRDGGLAAIGWSEIGSLEDAEATKAGKGLIRERVEAQFPGNAGVITRAAGQLLKFATGTTPGDTIVAMRGATVLGIGRVDGAYFYQPEDGPFAHRLPVTWLSTEEWKLPKGDGLRTTFSQLKLGVNLVEIERHLSDPMQLRGSRQQGGAKVGSPEPPRAKAPKLTGIPARIEDALRRKGQVVLYGPPGTGKTYWSLRAADELVARGWFGVEASALDDSKRESLREAGAVEQCSFHPSYGYEDFLAGYRPGLRDGQLFYDLRDGIFTRLCRRAAQVPDKPFYLLIDEINRGDIPRIFGELLTSLEKDKRGLPVTVPLMEDPLVVPNNVFVIGTMNTADRSVALLDAALRRRFAFVELMPDPSVLAAASVGGLPLGPWLVELNRRIVQFAGRDARNLQVGHSYLLHGGAPVQTLERFTEVLRDDILPLLQEYCYEDFGALEQILGKGLVKRDKQSFAEALFEPGGRGQLIEALLEAFADITATPDAASADTVEEEEEDLVEEGAESDDAGAT